METGLTNKLFCDIEDILDMAIEGEIDPILLKHLKQETLRKIDIVVDEQLGLLQQVNRLDAANTDKASRLKFLRKVLAEVIEELSRHGGCTVCSDLKTKIDKYLETAKTS